MRDFIVSVVMDVLSDIFVQYLERRSVSRISGSTWHFFILDTTEFVVLYPEIALHDFCRSGEAKQCRIAPGEMTATFRRFLFRPNCRVIARIPRPAVAAPAADRPFFTNVRRLISVFMLLHM